MKTGNRVQETVYRKKQDTGFTLLEILISVGILATVGTLVAQVLFTTTHVNTKSNLVADIKQNGEFALGSMERAIRGAIEIRNFCTLLDESTPSAFIIDAHNNLVQFTCVSDGTAARIASVSASGTQYLTGGKVTLSNSGGPTCDDSTLTFTCPDASGIPSPITVNFTLTQLGATTSAFENARSSFQTTVNIRR